MPKAKTIAEALQDHTSIDPVSGCWLWTGSTSGNRWKEGLGYGNLSNKGKNYRAHRASWEIHRGPIPKGMNVLHTCDVPRCCNPDHLYIGTMSDNARDMFSRGRSVNQTRPELLARGARNGVAKLTQEAVEEIRATKRDSIRLAAKFGITVNYVSHIRSRRVWAHCA